MLNVWRSFKECRHPSKKCLPRPSIYQSLIRHVTRAVPLRRLSHIGADSFPPHLVHAPVLFLECVTRVDRCLLPSTRMGTDPSRSEWQVENFVRQLRDKLHSSRCNVTEPENICPEECWAEFLSARLGLLRCCGLLWYKRPGPVCSLSLSTQIRVTETCLKLTCSLGDFSAQLTHFKMNLLPAY